MIKFSVFRDDVTLGRCCEVERLFFLVKKRHRKNMVCLKMTFVKI